MEKLLNEFVEQNLQLPEERLCFFFLNKIDWNFMSVNPNEYN